MPPTNKQNPCPNCLCSDCYNRDESYKWVKNMNKECMVKGCDNLIENAPAPDPRRFLCAERIGEYSAITEEVEEE